MDANAANELHQYIIQNGLVPVVEVETQRKYRAGSRSTYYSAMKKCLDKEQENLTLVERLMLEVAESVKKADELDHITLVPA